MSTTREPVALTVASVVVLAVSSYFPWMAPRRNHNTRYRGFYTRLQSRVCRNHFPRRGDCSEWRCSHASVEPSERRASVCLWCGICRSAALSYCPAVCLAPPSIRTDDGRASPCFDCRLSRGRCWHPCATRLDRNSPLNITSVAVCDPLAIIAGYTTSPSVGTPPSLRRVNGLFWGSCTVASGASQSNGLVSSAGEAWIVRWKSDRRHSKRFYSSAYSNVRLHSEQTYGTGVRLPDIS
jgi:hypothetical protein